MKKLFLLFALLITQCTASNEPIVEGVYTIFSLNVHDFVFAEESIEAVSHVIDIHEAYNVPVDIYVDDQVFQIYVEQAPELIERLKTSPVVTVGYHLRPPTPYYSDYKDFDYLGLNELSDEELYTTLLNYEEHKLDLETGKTLDAPGGYQFVKDTIGYAPPVVSTIVSSRRIQKILSQIYLEKGAAYTVVHGRSIDLGEKQDGLLIRPEHVDYKLYEKVKDGFDGQAAFEDALSQIPTEGLRFIGMKYHENNFYTVGTPFWPIYSTDSTKTQPLEPPFDLSAAEGVIENRSSEAGATYWELYESTVKYASEHRDEVHPISVRGLEELM
ncbi:MAG: hypothetical protein WC924_03275 [Candidatus Gracilibacteria bacterium]